MRTLVRNATVVTATSREVADVLVQDERIEAVGRRLTSAADRVIEAEGKLLLPGGVDVHTHLDMPLSASLRTADDFESGTIAAACGGTTTIVDHATQGRGESLRQALDAWLARAEGRAVVDFGFHMGICDLRPEIEAEMAELAGEGVPSFKVFMAYPGRLMLDDGAIFRVLRRAAATGSLVCVHAENGPVIDVLVAEALRAGHAGPAFHAATRPPLVEAEAVRRVIALAELAGAPLYVVHLSSALGLEAVRAARRRGVKVFAETCPQYLFLSEHCYEGDGREASKYVMSPPLRASECQDALWRGLAEGDVQVVATDHCPFPLHDKLAAADFSAIPNGAPGIETRMLLMFQAVCEGRLRAERFVEVTAAAPARLFGLFPKKGTIAAGSDADLVLIDPGGATTISAATHHSSVDYTLYEGQQLRGAIEMVFSRGDIIAEGRRFAGARGRGRFLRREAGPRAAV